MCVCVHTHVYVHARVISIYCLSTQTKLKAIQAYVAELSQQHEMLLETMDEMEREANKKISILEGKLTTSLQAKRVSRGPYFLLGITFSDCCRVI